MDLIAELPHRPEQIQHRGAIKEIIIHHSGANRTIKRPKAYVKAIARYHVYRLGSPSIAYHWCIAPDGTVYDTAPLAWRLEHAGKHSVNGVSAAICLLGNFHDAYNKKGKLVQMDPSEAQLRSARWLIKLGDLPVRPHKHVVQTHCPGEWERWGYRLTGG